MYITGNNFVKLIISIIQDSNTHMNTPITTILLTCKKHTNPIFKYFISIYPQFPHP